MKQAHLLLCATVFAVGSSSLVAVAEEVAYSLHDSFEKFDFVKKPNAEIRNTVSDSAKFTWTADTPVYVVSDGTAYHKKNYLSIQDKSSNQIAATIKLEGENRAPFIVCPKNLSDEAAIGTPFSFVFRRKVVEGQESNVSGVNMTLGYATTDETPTTGNLINGVNILSKVPADDSRWYKFEAKLLNYHWSATESQPIVYSIKITNIVTGTVVYTDKNTYRANLKKNVDCVVTLIKFATWSTGQAIVDIDDIRIGDVKESKGMAIFCS